MTMALRAFYSLFMNKLLLPILLSFVSLTTWASGPIRPKGLFTYFGPEVVQAREIEFVPSGNQERVKALMAQSYTCKNAGRFFKCTRSFTVTRIPQELLHRVTREWRLTRFNFIPSGSDVILVNEAPSITEWDVPDTVEWGDEVVTTYRSQRNDTGLEKAKIPFKSGTLEFIVSTDKFISTQKSYVFELDKFRQHEYSVEIHFDRF